MGLLWVAVGRLWLPFDFGLPWLLRGALGLFWPTFDTIASKLGCYFPSNGLHAIWSPAGGPGEGGRPPRGRPPRGHRRRHRRHVGGARGGGDGGIIRAGVKPQKRLEHKQSPGRLYKAPKDYTKPRQTIENPKTLYTVFKKHAQPKNINQEPYTLNKGKD